MLRREDLPPVLFSITCSIFGLFAHRYIQEAVKLSGPNLLQSCQLSPPVTYTHIASIDRLLCILAVFFRRAQDDYVGLHVTRVLLGVFGTVQGIMAIEGSRNGYNRWYHIVSWFMFWGMLANVITIAVVSSLLWVPLFVVTSAYCVTRVNSAVSVYDDSTIPAMVNPVRSMAILLSILLAYGVPSLLMTTSLIAEPGSWLSNQVIVAWQFCPIAVQIIYIILTRLLAPIMKDDRISPLPAAVEDASTAVLSSTKTVKSTASKTSSSSSMTTTMRSTTTKIETSGLELENNHVINRQRQRIRVAQSKSSVEQVYLVLAVINLFIYYGSFVQIRMDGVHLKDSLLLLVTKTFPAAGLDDVEITQFYSAHTLLLDLIILTFTYAAWSLYEDGLLVFLALVMGIIITGPGCALALYALYREHRIQNPDNLKLDIDKVK